MISAAGPVTDDGHPVYAPNGATTGCVRRTYQSHEPYGDSLDRGLRQHRRQLLGQEAVDSSGHAFREFQQDVAHEAVADDDVGLAVGDIHALDISYEIEATFLQQVTRFLDHLVAFALFRAHIEKAHGGIIYAVELPDKDAPGHREFQQIAGLTADVGPHIQHEGIRSQLQERPSDNGTLNTRQTAQMLIGIDHEGSGRAGADHRIGLAIFD